MERDQSAGVSSSAKQKVTGGIQSLTSGLKKLSPFSTGSSPTSNEVDIPRLFLINLLIQYQIKLIFNGNAC